MTVENINSQPNDKMEDILGSFKVDVKAKKGGFYDVSISRNGLSEIHYTVANADEIGWHLADHIIAAEENYKKIKDVEISSDFADSMEVGVLLYKDEKPGLIVFKPKKQPDWNPSIQGASYAEAIIKFSKTGREKTIEEAYEWMSSNSDITIGNNKYINSADHKNDDFARGFRAGQIFGCESPSNRLELAATAEYLWKSGQYDNYQDVLEYVKKTMNQPYKIDDCIKDQKENEPERE